MITVVYCAFNIVQHSSTQGSQLLHGQEETTLYQKSDLCITRNELRGLVPNSYIHVSARDLYIGLPNWMQQNRQTDLGNI